MELPVRKKLRLNEYDYATNGAYFITICTENRRPVLADVNPLGRRCGQNPHDTLPLSYGDATTLPYIVTNSIGQIVQSEICLLPSRFSVSIPKYVIMPNHVHLLVVTFSKKENGTATIPDMMRVFKSITTKRVNQHDGLPGRKLWQRSYYDHIIRNEREFQQTWRYIDDNPMNWTEECLNTGW